MTWCVCWNSVAIGCSLFFFLQEEENEATGIVQDDGGVSSVLEGVGKSAGASSEESSDSSDEESSSSSSSSDDEEEDLSPFAKAKRRIQVRPWCLLLGSLLHVVSIETTSEIWCRVQHRHTSLTCGLCTWSCGHWKN